MSEEKSNQNPQTKPPQHIPQALLEVLPEEVLSKLPEDPKDLVAFISESVTGPIPPPSMLKMYEEVLPGAADRIMSMAESEQNIRKKAMQGFFSNDQLRILGGFLVSLALIGGAVYCAILGQTGLGSVLGVSGIVPVFPRIIKLFIGKE